MGDAQPVELLTGEYIQPTAVRPHTVGKYFPKGGQSRAVTLFRNLAVDGPLKSYIDVAASAYAADQSLHNTLTNHTYNKGYAQFPNCFTLETLEGLFKSGITLTFRFHRVTSTAKKCEPFK
ncbi:hypothetical protein N7447_004969 [Penicillium robsamsonii]|uniref:uncharacterized protein n=1 Tax=Penicillium robsamsonii TaxID=1792511 RepID=UPI002547AD1A|nr:uncharacterized protein N7447_004969 [Penicillium robsamsonii]KAJ5822629.1 hypothetical protein N7447_004969 [Penicillium robsamsonii]